MSTASIAVLPFEQEVQSGSTSGQTTRIRRVEHREVEPPPRIDRRQLSGSVLMRGIQLKNPVPSFVVEPRTGVQPTNAFTTVMARLRELREESASDEYGVSRPTDSAFVCAWSLVHHAFLRVQELFLLGSPSVDLRGGVRLTWSRDDREIRLVCPPSLAERTYLYYESRAEYGLVENVSPGELARWLRWVNQR